MISEDLGGAVQEVLQLVDKKGQRGGQAGPLGVPTPIRILIDGRSGSGKTTLALVLGEVLDIPVYGSEYWAPGWEGLAQGSRTTEKLVSGRAPSYRRWDWETYAFAEEVPFDANGSWIVEGCGALTPRTAPHADVRIWVEADPEVAKARGLGRDGDTYGPYWETWNNQEIQHWEKNDPASLADVTIRT